MITHFLVYTIISLTSTASLDSVTFESDIRSVQTAGALAAVTLEDGSLVVLDRSGTVVARLDLALEHEHQLVLMPEPRMAVVYRDVFYDRHSIWGKIRCLLGDDSAIELWEIETGTLVFRQEIDGNFGNLDVAPDLDLIAWHSANLVPDPDPYIVGTLASGETSTRLTVMRISDHEILLEEELPLGWGWPILSDSGLYRVLDGAVQIYRPDENALPALEREMRFDLEFEPFRFCHVYYDNRRTRMAILNESVDSTIGPITLIANRYITQEVKGIKDLDWPPRVTYFYRHTSKELFVSEDGRYLHIFNYENGSVNKFRMDELIGRSGDACIWPFGEELCLAAPFDDEGERHTLFIFRLPE